MYANRLKRRLEVALWVAAFSFGPTCYADKIDLSAGYFDLVASYGGKSAALYNFGDYQLQYRKSITSQFELGLGYTILMSNGIGGSIAYGLDFAGYYYPFGPSEPLVWTQNHTNVFISELWRPFIGLSLNQRQFNGNASFAGGGGLVGVEYALQGGLNLMAEARYIYLVPVNGTLQLQDIDGLIGMTFSFQTFK